MASFDENGKYIKMNWKAGDKITATKLNKIEESIEAVNDNDISRHVEADARLDALEAKDVTHDKELTNIKNTIADNKAAAELGDYDINSRMTFLENELEEGIEEVHNVAETVDGKIATAEANMTAQVNQGKADMEAMVAEVEAYKICINIKEFGAKGDGLTDDTASFRNAIDNLSENATLEISEGNYIITEQLVINKQQIRIQGKGTITFDNTSLNGNASIFCITGSTDVYISDLTLKTKDFQDGCAISILNNCSNITIENVYIYGFKNVGINCPLASNNTNVKILGNNILKCKFGIGAAANGIIISNNYINNLWYESDEFLNTGEWIADVPYYDGIIIAGSNFIISNNVIEGNGQSGIYTGGSKGGIISNNTIRNNHNCGVDLGIVGDYSEPDNYISDLSVANNCVYGNRHHQINITGVKNSVFTGNYAYNNSDIAYPMIFTNGSNGNLVSNNILNDGRTDDSARGG